MSADKIDHKAGDVFRYEPSREWCREGMAVVRERDGALIDTYWHGGSDSHALTDKELATSELIFNVNDYRELGHYERFDDYRLEDRQVITSQHGLSVRRFLKTGAKPDRATRITNAIEAVNEAEEKLRSAQRLLDSRQEDLSRIIKEEATA